WGPAGQTGPCGPDTEMFYDTEGGEIAPGEGPDSNEKRFTEIWNDVFMQYFKKEDGTFEPLKQKNVDTGMGLERVTAILQGKSNHFETELFKPLMDKVLEISGAERTNENIVSLRIIADHMRAATFILGDPWGVAPSNTDQGYVLRRLIRRAIRHGKQLGIESKFTNILSEMVIQIYKDVYPELAKNKDRILLELDREEEKFGKTILQGIREMRKKWSEDAAHKSEPVSDGAAAFFIYETYGFPLEMIEEELKKMGYEIEVGSFRDSFNKALADHQAKSRAGSEQKFSGGLADHGEETTKLHTATHLLHQSLRNLFGEDIMQKGSNITAERLRFDFNYPEKLNEEQIKQVEDMVNEQIKKDWTVTCETTSVEEAKERGAIGLFEDKYGDKIKLYRIGDFSLEICGGPHVEHTGQLEAFKITKQESVGSGIRRVKAVIGEEAKKRL
ncbi:alanine--tRNA ligase, partial [Candidatus Peregrinibacteria bacterium]|nr:alanine--tRNA ligase [Candidatus Peregrinibacteria bacterium]